MKRIFVMNMLVLMMVSCASLNKVDFSGVEKIVVRKILLTGMDIELFVDISNKSRKDITVREIEVDVFSVHGNKLFNITLVEPVVIPSYSDDIFGALFRVRIPRSSLTWFGDMLGGDDKVRVKGTARLTGKGFNQKFRFDRKMDSAEFRELITSQFEF